MGWESFLVFAVLALATGYALRRTWRSLVAGKACCNCGQRQCASRAGGETPIPVAAPVPATQGVRDAT